MIASPFKNAMSRAWLTAALAVGAFGAAFAPAADGDLYWHLAAGREMWRTHALLTTDPFSISAAGKPWPDVHWLFQLALYALHSLGGLGALVLVKCLLVAAGALILQSAVERRARPLFVLALLAGLFACRHLLLVRPVIVTLVLLAIFLRALERQRRTGGPSALWPLPLLQIVWANVQGLSALGPAVVGVYALGAFGTELCGRSRFFPFPRSSPRGSVRALAVTAALCVVASFVTPFGLRAAALPARLLGRIAPVGSNVFSAAIAENVPPFVLEQSVPAEVWHFKWYLALLAVGVVLGARRLTLGHVLLLAGFVGLALMANRNVVLLYWMAPAVVAPALVPRLVAVRLRLAKGRLRLVPAAAAALAIVGVLALVGVAAAREPAFGEPAPFRVPWGSTQALARLRSGGPVFSADHQGGYLIWRLYPRFRPYIDTRLVLRTAEQYAEYLALAEEPARFEAFQRRYGFVAVILPVGYPDRYLGLVRHLYGSRDWKLDYTDGTEVLFTRREGWADLGVDLGAKETTERLVADADRRFAGEERLRLAARLQIATLDLVVGQLGEAERSLAGLGEPEASALLSRVRLARGDLEGAERLGTDALTRDSRDVRALSLLATVSARRGEIRRAAGYLRQALAVDPFDGEASGLLASMEAHTHDL
jgi:hypothetical protein